MCVHVQYVCTCSLVFWERVFSATAILQQTELVKVA